MATYTLHGKLGILARYNKVEKALTKLTDAAREHIDTQAGNDIVTLQRDGVVLMTVVFRDN